MASNIPGGGGWGKIWYHNKRIPRILGLYNKVTGWYYAYQLGRVNLLLLYQVASHSSQESLSCPKYQCFSHDFIPELLLTCCIWHLRLVQLESQVHRLQERRHRSPPSSLRQISKTRGTRGSDIKDPKPSIMLSVHYLPCAVDSLDSSKKCFFVKGYFCCTHYIRG